MEIGLLIRYGKVVPGRETEAIQLFEDGERFFKDKLSKGLITHYEPFFLASSDLEEDTGFHIIKGPAPEIFKLMEEEEYKTFLTRTHLLLEHLRVDLLTVGEGVREQMERFAKVRAELGV